MPSREVDLNDLIASSMPKPKPMEEDIGILRSRGTFVRTRDIGEWSISYDSCGSVVLNSELCFPRPLPSGESIGQDRWRIAWIRAI